MRMSSIELNVDIRDLHFFDVFLRKGLVKPPVVSLRSHGSYSPESKAYQLIYEVHIRKEEKEYDFGIELSATQKKVSLSVKLVSPKQMISKKERERLLKLFILRIKEAEKNAKDKPLKTFQYEAHLSTSVYPLRSTIQFGKYKLAPLNKRGEQGWECKLRFGVEAIDKDESLTNATVEAKRIVAWLSLAFATLIRLKSFSEITVDPKPVIHFEKIRRPDLRGVKHLFAHELEVPHDFMELWDNFCSLPSEMGESFVSSCLCFQLAMEMRATHPPLSYQLFVTAVEVIAREVIKAGPSKRFVEFICRSLEQSDERFRKLVRRFYDRRSALVHEKGVGLGLIPTFGIRSFDQIPGSELWHLEIYVNAALIGFLKSCGQLASHGEFVGC